MEDYCIDIDLYNKLTKVGFPGSMSLSQALFWLREERNIEATPVFKIRTNPNLRYIPSAELIDNPEDIDISPALRTFAKFEDAAKVGVECACEYLECVMEGREWVVKPVFYDENVQLNDEKK